MLPEISFSSDGVFLPSTDRSTLRFKSVNVKEVDLKITKVYENNILYFLQDQKLDSSKTSDSFYGLNRVGVDVVSKTLKIGNNKNEWLQHEIDLSKLLAKDSTGLFIIKLSFEREDMLYNLSSEHGSYYGDDYYNNPNSYGYISKHGKIFKPLIISDIGLTAKITDSGCRVYATNVTTAEPMPNLLVRIKDYQNQVVFSGNTDAEGKLVAPVKKGKLFLVEAEHDGQRSIIKPSEMRWELSSFETGGVSPSESGIKTFIYTERGVYRPGDSFNISLIARDKNDSFPSGHPVTLKLYNPNGQLMHTETKSDSEDGFYTFACSTKPEDQTGNWQANFKIGSSVFHHTVKVETVVPYKLKVTAEADKEILTQAEDKLSLKLASNYLVGAPAASHKVKVTAKLLHTEKSFKNFKKYSFTNEASSFKAVTETILDGELDSDGKATVEWKLPALKNVPSALTSKIRSSVFEKGGRPVINTISIPVDPYETYVGIRKPELRYDTAEVGKKLELKTVAVARDGKAIAGKDLKYRIYRNNSYWWWESDSLSQYKLKFKNKNSTELVKEGSFISAASGNPIVFTPGESGYYLVEVQDGTEGHTSSTFIYSGYWGSAGASPKDAAILSLSADKTSYLPGDEAKITFPTPKEGTILLTVEKLGEILKEEWIKPAAEEDTTTVTFEITDKMVPNAYVSVSVFQKHGKSSNNRPIRMYGIIPVKVKRPGSEERLSIKTTEHLEPGKEFEVEVETLDGTDTQLTVAVVDEGLLALTNFATPDPWNSFYSKERLGVTTFDLYDKIINPGSGDVFSRFVVGGDMDSYKKSQQMSRKANRFKPVSMFSGIVETENGKAKVKFTMPEYIGAVRIMAVSAKGAKYGAAEKSVKVKKDLMVQPYLPRFLAPTDSITFPVSVFAMSDKIKDVEVTVKTEGPIEMGTTSQRSVTFQKEGKGSLSSISRRCPQPELPR